YWPDPGAMTAFTKGAEAVILKILIGNRPKRGRVHPLRREDHEAIAVPHWQRPQQYGIDHTEYRGVDANAERERQHRRGGEDWRTAKEPRSEYKIPHARQSTPTTMRWV